MRLDQLKLAVKKDDKGPEYGEADITTLARIIDHLTFSDCFVTLRIYPKSITVGWITTEDRSSREYGHIKLDPVYFRDHTVEDALAQAAKDYDQATTISPARLTGGYFFDVAWKHHGDSDDFWDEYLSDDYDY